LVGEFVGESVLVGEGVIVADRVGVLVVVAVAERVGVLVAVRVGERVGVGDGAKAMTQEENSEVSPEEAEVAVLVMYSLTGTETDRVALIVASPELLVVTVVLPR